MTVFIIRRLMQAALVVLVMSFLVFSGVFLVGDPTEILVADDADQAERAAVIESLGLDKPFHIQYLRFLTKAAEGDLGESFVFNEPALQLILDRLPATMELAIAALLISIVFGIPLGVLAGLETGRRVFQVHHDRLDSSASACRPSGSGSC
ncbi:MAG: ABC transporter permease [Thalassobaculum sp.]